MPGFTAAEIIYQVRHLRWENFGLLVIAGLAGGLEARASGSEGKRIYLGAGALSHDAGRLSRDGATSLTAAVYPELALMGRFPLGASWGVSPLVNYTPIGKKSPEGLESTTVLAAGLRAFRRFKAFELHLGPGVLIYRISGEGGLVTLNNGGSTKVYGAPSESVSSRVFYVDAGAGLGMGRWHLSADCLVSGVGSSRRAVTPVISLSYGLF